MVFSIFLTPKLFLSFSTMKRWAYFGSDPETTHNLISFFQDVLLPSDGSIPCIILGLFCYFCEGDDLMTVL